MNSSKAITESIEAAGTAALAQERIFSDADTEFILNGSKLKTAAKLKSRNIAASIPSPQLLTPPYEFIIAQAEFTQ
jgi:hypothetical protein